MTRRAAVIAILALGCIAKPQHPAATQPATIANRATTQPSYWYAQPASNVVIASDLDGLVDACRSVTRQFGFRVDRADYRLGLITSQPLISSQFFEFWESDIKSVKDSEDASMRTTRRTIRWDITRRDDGEFEAAPKVLVEHQTISEQRITSVALYRGAFNRTNTRERQMGTKESDEGIDIPLRYWYSVGRDQALERDLAAALRKQLMKH